MARLLLALLFLSVAQPVLAADSEALVIHVLNRTGYGPRPGEVARVQAMGVARYVDAQLYPERIPDGDIPKRLASLRSLALPPAQLVLTYPPNDLQKRIDKLRAEGKTEEAARLENAMAPESQRGKPREVLTELGSAKLVRAVHSNRQLEEVMVDFWFNHFNVNWSKGAERWLVTAYEREVIRPHAFGKFRDLLLASAQSPAMLFYLDNWLSSSATAPARRDRKPGLNENYARELLELHTLGVDGGYTQNDVVEVARCLTGWTLSRPRDGGGFVFRPRMHDSGQKVVLGKVIRAGGGKEDGIAVIDMLARHPKTARFIATKLCLRFVADDPPKTLVDRVAAVFLRTDGDLRQTVRAVLTSPEFLSAKYAGAKIKTPLELVASSIRAVGGETKGGTTLLAALNRMGMPLYLCQPPTGYADRADAWVSSGALLERLSFAVALMEGRMVGTTVEAERILPRPDLDRAIEIILGARCSAETRATLSKEMPVSSKKLVGLILGSPEFQRR